MPFARIEMSPEQKSDFVEIMCDVKRKGLTVPEIAKRFGISTGTIYLRTREPEIAEMIKRKRADIVKARLPEIDLAVIQQALKGSIPAATLVYERWDDFVRRQGLEVGKLETLTPEQKKERADRIKEYIEAIKGGNTPPSLPAQSTEISNITHIQADTTPLNNNLHSDATMINHDELPHSSGVQVSQSTESGKELLSDADVGSTPMGSAAGGHFNQATPTTNSSPYPPLPLAAQFAVIDLGSIEQAIEEEVGKMELGVPKEDSVVTTSVSDCKCGHYEIEHWMGGNGFKLCRRCDSSRCG